MESDATLALGQPTPPLPLESFNQILIDEDSTRYADFPDHPDDCPLLKSVRRIMYAAGDHENSRLESIVFMHGVLKELYTLIN